MELFRTADMSIVALLRVKGIPHMRTEWGKRKKGGDFCSWIFFSSDRVDQLVTGYKEGSELVEPMGYSEALESIRKEMWSGHPKPERRPQALPA